MSESVPAPSGSAIGGTIGESSSVAARVDSKKMPILSSVSSATTVGSGSSGGEMDLR